VCYEHSCATNIREECASFTVACGMTGRAKLKAPRSPLSADVGQTLVNVLRFGDTHSALRGFTQDYRLPILGWRLPPVWTKACAHEPPALGYGSPTLSRARSPLSTTGGAAAARLPSLPYA